MTHNQSKYHSVLANFFLRTAFSRRKVRELPWQLMVSGDVERLYDLYSDLPFFHLAWRTDRYETKEFWNFIEKKSSYSPSGAYQSLIKSPTDDKISYCEDISDLLLDTYNIKDAIPLLEFQVQYYRRKDYQFHLLRSIANYATALRESGMFGPAMKWYEEQAKIAQKGGHLLEYSTALGNQASILILQSKYDLSTDLLTRQENLLKTLNDRYNLIICQNNQSVIYRCQGESIRAKGLLAEVMNLARETDKEMEAACELNMGVLMYDEKNFTEAGAKFEYASEVFNRIGSTSRIGSALNNQALSCWQKGDIQGAITLINILESSCLKNNDQITLQPCLYNKALIYIQLGKTDIASDLLFRTEKTARKLEMTEGICRSLIGKALLSVITTGASKKADILLMEAGNLVGKSGPVLLHKTIESVKDKIKSQSVLSNFSYGWIVPIVMVSMLNFTGKSVEVPVESELLVPDWSLLGEAEIMQFIRNGGNPALKDKDGGTALMSAVSLRSKYLVEVLISHKADINAGDTNGTSALMIASNKGDTQIMQKLLQAGANPNQYKADGFTPLLFAVQSGNSDAVRLLLQIGADPDKSAINGLAPIHLAAFKCVKEIVKELIAFGADPYRKMDDGSTAFDIARGSCPGLFDYFNI